ncbi:MAG: hypothetical protein ACRYFX_03770 [Janthinobacterium lividum]
MKSEILTRIQQLGGNIDQVDGQSLQADLQAITFSTVLYPRPENTQWATADDTEPIYGLGEFMDENRALFTADPTAFYQKITDHFYQKTVEPHGQMFFRNDLFTPFREGTADYDDWNQDFSEPGAVDLSEVYKITGDKTPDFICLAYSYRFPDNYYICLSDPHPENPTVFGTDHEVFFSEVTNEGTLEAFFQRFMTKEELLEIVRKRLEK